MAALDEAREIAAAWVPQRPGRRAPRDVGDALVEPGWGGLRVVAALAAGEAAVYHGGREVGLPGELGDALVAALGTVEAVVEGHLTTLALRTGEGMLPPPPEVERPPILVPRAVRRSVREDPWVQARDHEARAAGQAPAVLEAIARGVRHAFVATDLLWLDGQGVDDVPLLERKRLLEGALVASELVRVSPFVRPSAAVTLVTWGALGFPELSWRSANSRYLAGRENPDWAVAPPPRGPGGAGGRPA